MYVLYNIQGNVLLIKLMRKLYQILYNVGRLTYAPGWRAFPFQGDSLAVELFPFRGDTLAWASLRGGKALRVTKPAFPPRAPPFRARKLLQVVEMCSGTGGAMDAAVLDMKHCADLFLFSTTFPVNHLLPPDHKETQPFHPAVQRSADSSSNSRAATLPYRPEKPAREACAACRRTLQEGS